MYLPIFPWNQEFLSMSLQDRLTADDIQLLMNSAVILSISPSVTSHNIPNIHGLQPIRY